MMLLLVVMCHFLLMHSQTSVSFFFFPQYFHRACHFFPVVLLFANYYTFLVGHVVMVSELIYYIVSSEFGSYRVYNTSIFVLI